ncbi:C40 family peptidase [Halobacillus sp. BBL2006]|uniref:C40 family peptidase n=1 Tax=Halobacillus sp. BBL2006 TaxID=1543706 RepID=UPI0005426BE3|nr:C40 family peptidase [Halobacillus sp. BBL2006]KHE67954.1 peptidase [Halobacillus sp. BBL2006]
MTHTPTKTTWVVQVPVATVWTSPESPRAVDERGVSDSASMKEWLNHLTYETSLALCDDNLVQSQLLYGEEVLVEERSNGWAHIIVPTQASKKDEHGYPGYVPEHQLKEIPQENWQGSGVAVVHKKHTMLLDQEFQPFLEMSYLTSLPALLEEGEFLKVRTPHGEGYLSIEDVTLYPSRAEIPKGTGKDLIEAGEAFLDLPYFWGGMSAYGYDCSGFAYNMHKAHGYEIPRDATDQAMAGEEVPLDQLQPGDLLFFAYEEGKGRIHHVGFYYGDGKMLHSPNTGKTIEIIELKGTTYEKELCCARRYWQEKGAST